ncbi:MAG: UDP-N-acetylglucosamine 2-epimerase, partial [Thermoanaerobaculia bacterium]
MKILSIVGARPQFIKEFPINRQIENFPLIKEILVHTGQHYDYEMSKIFFEELELPEPDYHLGIGSGEQGEQTGKMIIEIEKVLKKERPDIVFVYGDTNSTIAGALASVKLKIPVAHIEAGLRSFRMDMPEEVNRVLTYHISTFLFCPTKTAVENLKREGISKNSRKKILDINEKYVYLVGDV